MAQMHCIEFASQRPTASGPNPWIVPLETHKVRFTAYAPPGAPPPPYVLAPHTRIWRLGAFTGLDCNYKLDIRFLRFRARRVAVKLVTFARPAKVEAFAGTQLVASQKMDPVKAVPQLLVLSGKGINRVEIVPPSDETILLELCVLI
jgi:hypothetical protein